MITVKQQENRITVAGHAGPAPDLVCEDVTALYQSMVLSLQALTDDEITNTVESGFAVLTYKTNLSERARLLMDSFLVGVCAISNTFPDLVRVSRLE